MSLDLASELSRRSNASMTPIVPVILSGGSGTRLWPVSRESFPKQFWPLVSENSLIADTALRTFGGPFSPPLVVCNEAHRFMVAEQLRESGISGARILLEPVGRNSAPAIAAAALVLAQDDPQAVICMMAADAAIPDSEALRQALLTAASVARTGKVVTLGMRPTRPETGFGYIEMGTPLAETPEAHTLTRFIEKPDGALAEQLIATGRALWNSGIYVFTVSTLLEELQAHAPHVLATARKAVEARTTDLDFIRLGREEFAACPNISIDYAVAEHSTRAAVVPVDFAWSDVGSWSALWDLGEKDAAGNVAIGDAVLEGARNCYVRSDGMLATVLGLEDVVLVVTEDAVLAAHKDRAQDVKKIVERLKKESRPEAVSHNLSYRPWGHYEVLILGDRFQVKRIVVKPGEKLSLQSHFHRAEHWVVVEGTAIVTRDEDEVLVRENESIYLPLGCKHRLYNPGRIPLTLIEVQSGAYLGEDDIVRFQDTYGRS
ncbi:MAG TPA: mannose-1-phosphate guanylyltransferase/mannose-6-phosphate isomerase [Acidisoma sp.]|jgi:mannose-1-phosphate guanylyltransferase/mannose-6-phosphate isomerase|uniref:mannose-1-phosphate guanylyltransferase/mannose-6-phosphate isomerase n=1 Tax=Acidisoma sp. TaxID=1872115 RepID=UPI002C41AACA|nr:mannose-1-phosphate guanylyltransferase/mannose-6-phosphate isomerase [Acidisoma sp.]HTI01241.1 mannose-1-phosphate guanylyltransferase/mannose-6-phosphate isomerase [Acidisoma sp.]